MTRRSELRHSRYLEDQIVSKLDATPEPNHFNAMQAQLESDLINVQDHVENMWLLATELDAVVSEDDKLSQSQASDLAAQKEQVMQFLKRMRMIAGISIEMPNRDERRKYLKNNAHFAG